MIINKFKMLQRNESTYVSKIGFTCVFTTFKKQISQIRINVLTSFIDANYANNTFYSDYFSHSNRLYNRMKFLGLHEINVININRNPIEEYERFFILPVEYNRPDDWVFKRDEDEIKSSLIVNVYNLTFEEFFDFDSIYFMMKEEQNNTIFFFETEDWSEVINNFYMCGIFVSGGNTNLRHIFDSLDYSFSILLTTLFGKNFAQNCTNFMKFKNVKKDLFNPNFNYNSIESKIFRLFNTIVWNKKIELFYNVSKIIIIQYNFPKLDKVNPWDLLKIWLIIIYHVDDCKDLLKDILFNILTLINENKNEDEIWDFIKKEKGYNKNISIKINEREILDYIAGKEELSRYEFFKKRFSLNSLERDSFNEKVGILNDSLSTGT